MNITRNNILIISGEPSGDARGAELLRELKPLACDMSFWGIGGDRLRDEGLELIEHVKNLSIVGVWEALTRIGTIRSQYKKCVENIRRRKPVAAILVDYPGFNLRIAKYLSEQSIPVIYYIIPQVWAWGRGRVRQIERYTDKVLVLFEFEKHFLQKYNIASEFVGHPIVDIPVTNVPEKGKRDNLTIALLPGSRKSEIRNLFPAMLRSARILHDHYKGKISFIVAENSNLDKMLYTALEAEYVDLNMCHVKDDTIGALAGSDFALVTSGTATLEAAITQTPFLLLYKTAAFTAFLFYTFLNLPYVGLVNIIAGKEVAPELLQKNVTPEKISKKTLEMLADVPRMEQARNELREVKKLLGDKGAAKRAAVSVAAFLDSLSGNV
ncbi:MAG: lipid-A-disaccharide synthase [Candidatus Omnitrophica bacterium]|nr:lipid-A-disaccharide synthase [Candidatus Omnitrophota bacterium]MBU1128146.1 lipid-A-disaccharide synthase [Candidatus Omnitrophota bacterium]MBU1656804.1 lipid-A-disaccharide synthase [Candidatus Omnitrophota bacterium]MBU1784249.1 lipid-A-disaccharide synthase [Candidatus Omnitrophota bacterium]MBU1851290.1 lipid-A-disaccharide synthase [Candidatus Omnitrophota bacterium]